MRIYLHGGVWKNSEDELLKAGAMKYGTQNWARVASLLPRKTAAQCKARWYNWLDPSIKKTEWTRDEDERLLYLAKTRSTEWQSIASLVGRTPAQCLERYERLLDEATAKASGVTLDPKQDPRRLRAGERDPMPETRPARPDPVDMEDEEMEMLAEARARLANTRGKKAKRKARDKQLKTAQHIVSLRKMRELKAAGLEVRQKRQREGVDYATEVPFRRDAPIGFFDTSAEDAAAASLRAGATDFEGDRLQATVAKRREEEEARRRKDSVRKSQKEAAADLPHALAEEARRQDPAHVAKRTKLSLPRPQMGAEDIEALARLGPEALGAGGAAGADGFDGASVLGSVAMPPPTGPHRSRTARDAVMEEARNLIVRRDRPTPLQGGAHPELEAGIQSLTPKGGTAEPRNPTMNPLAARLAAAGAITPGAVGARSVVGGGSVMTGQLTDGAADAAADAADIGDSASVVAGGAAASVAGQSTRSSWTMVSRGGRLLRDKLGLNRSLAGGQAGRPGSVLGLGLGGGGGGGTPAPLGGDGASSVAGSTASSAWDAADSAEVEALSVLAAGVPETKMTRDERRGLRAARARVAQELATLPAPVNDASQWLDDGEESDEEAAAAAAGAAGGNAGDDDDADGDGDGVEHVQAGAASSASSSSVAGSAWAAQAEAVAARLRGAEAEEIEEDAEEAEKRAAAAREAAARAEFRRRSAALRHEERLPRPPAPSAEALSAAAAAAHAEAEAAAVAPARGTGGASEACSAAELRAAALAIDAEVLALVRADAFRFPVTSERGRLSLPAGQPPATDTFDDRELAAARALIEEAAEGEGLGPAAGAASSVQAELEMLGSASAALWLPSRGEWVLADQLELPAASSAPPPSSSPSSSSSSSSSSSLAATSASAASTRGASSASSASAAAAGVSIAASDGRFSFSGVSPAELAEARKLEHASAAAAVAAEERRVLRRAEAAAALTAELEQAAAAERERQVKAHAQYSDATMRLAAFARLYKAEQAAGERRAMEAQEALDSAVARERQLQQRFDALSRGTVPVEA
ncbi:hypothetical protein FNF31_05284 [Cafeteria roenbergensis]|uniref:Cell division cycle 5-like protein n=1 Tax=Cafeteria roenbergensis TaxID=33653 RepID=A0A5A8E4U1_CAFRO|nr:hypothetical protein FNF31_05284 [Cafeteria roenbergensis]KAA0171857.1 hypothetical protein FNF28_00492 [Cafeteria roenbergensis]